MTDTQFSQYQLEDITNPTIGEQQAAIYKTQDGVTPFDQFRLPTVDTSPSSSPQSPTSSSNPSMLENYMRVIGGNVVLNSGNLQSDGYVKGVIGWQISDDGQVEFNNGTFRGALIAASIDIPDITTANSFHVNSSGDAWWGATTIGAATASVTKAGLATFTNVNITGGTVATTALNKAVMGWTSNIVFTSASAVQVNWSAGSIKLEDTTTFSISAGNTSTMAALTYIYLDTAISSTVLQVSTNYALATGDNRILIAMAQNNTVGASVIPLGGGQPIIDGTAQITALSITAASIAASTITAAKLTVSQLSAIAADLGAITAGTIVLSSAGYIRSGQTDYATGTGFFLGISGAATKFSIGDATNYITWDGSTLSVQGVSAVSKSYTSGEAITAGNAVVIGFYQSDGGITLDMKNQSNGTVAAGGTVTITSVVVASQSNRAMTLFVHETVGSGSPGTVTATYNSVAMTQQDTTTVGNMRVTSFVLFSPSTGSHSIVISHSGGSGTHTYNMVYYSYYNVSTSAVDGHGISTSGTDTATVNQVVTANGSLISASGSSQSTGFALTRTNFGNNTQANSTGLDTGSGDSGIVMPPQTAALSIKFASSTVVALATISLAPATAPVSGYVFQSRATNSGLQQNRYNAFVGFAKTTVAANAMVAVTIAGEVSGLSGLAATPSFYYLSDTLGAIATTVGTNTRKVGISLTTTSLLVTNIW